MERSIFCKIKQQYISLIILLLAGRSLNVVDSYSTVIDSTLLDSVHGVPTLGKGYTLTSNSFLSSCLDIHDTSKQEALDFECTWNVFWYFYFIKDFSIMDVFNC